MTIAVEATRRLIVEKLAELWPQLTRQQERREGDGRTKVTFEIPADGVDTSVSVVGEFNDWTRPPRP